MSGDDVVFLGKSTMWARRPVADAWAAAGSPPINSAGRLKREQLDLRIGWEQRLPGYQPADDPRDPSQPLAHVRGVALDITPTPERVARLEAAGLVRPYDYEDWHWQLPGDVRRFPLVTALPNTPTRTKKGTHMHLYVQTQGDLTTWILFNDANGKYQTTQDTAQANRWAALTGADATPIDSDAVLELENVRALFFAGAR